jgi:MtN3 and saliva related transmembrane protein
MDIATWDIAAWLGSLAAIASTVSFAPQAWKVIRSRRTKDISAVMYGFTVIGFALWLAYGVAISQWPIIICNGICLLLAGFILFMKLSPQKVKDGVADKIDPTA